MGGAVSVSGQLPVDRDYAGRGIGAVMVQAKSEAARGFYLSCAEFLEFPEEGRTLFLPIETVVGAFG